MLKSLGIVFVILLIALVGTHGYMKMEYNTMNACDAALVRIKADLDSKGILGKGQSFLIRFGEAIVGKDLLAKDLEEDIGTLGCYKIALLGSEPMEFEKNKGSNP